MRPTSGPRFGYGGPEMTSTLCPKATSARDRYSTYTPWPPTFGADRYDRIATRSGALEAILDAHNLEGRLDLLECIVDLFHFVEDE